MLSISDTCLPSKSNQQLTKSVQCLSRPLILANCAGSTCTKAANTGKFGGGKIFVTTLEQITRISTDETE